MYILSVSTAFREAPMAVDCGDDLELLIKRAEGFMVSLYGEKHKPMQFDSCNNTFTWEHNSQDPNRTEYFAVMIYEPGDLYEQALIQARRSMERRNKLSGDQTL